MCAPSLTADSPLSIPWHTSEQHSHGASICESCKDEPGGDEPGESDGRSPEQGKTETGEKQKAGSQPNLAFERPGCFGFAFERQADGFPRQQSACQL